MSRSPYCMACPVERDRAWQVRPGHAVGPQGRRSLMKSGTFVPPLCEFRHFCLFAGPGEDGHMNAGSPYSAGQRSIAPGPPHDDTLGEGHAIVPGPACCRPAHPVARVTMPVTAARPHPTELLLCGHHTESHARPLPPPTPRSPKSGDRREARQTRCCAIFPVPPSRSADALGRPRLASAGAAGTSDLEVPGPPDLTPGKGEKTISNGRWHLAAGPATTRRGGGVASGRVRGPSRDAARHLRGTTARSVWRMFEFPARPG
jgi:hypothetical protein